MPAGIGYTGRLARLAGSARARVPRSMVAGAASRVGRARSTFAGGNLGRVRIPRTVGRSSGAGAGFRTASGHTSVAGMGMERYRGGLPATIPKKIPSPNGSSKFRQVMTNKYVWGGAAVGAGALAISRNTGRPTDRMGRTRPTGVYQY